MCVLVMKKTILLCLVSMLLIGMPISIGIHTPIQPVEKHPIGTSTDQPFPVEEPPNWANGNFSGVWGLDIWGEHQIPLGWVYGYYKNMDIGYFLGVFADWSEDNYSKYLSGLFFGPYMIGKIGNITDDGEMNEEGPFVGLGGYNETHFYWRVMGIKGPTFFMYGEYTKFD